MVVGMSQPYIILLLVKVFVERLWVGMGGVGSGVNLYISIGIGAYTI